MTSFWLRQSSTVYGGLIVTCSRTTRSRPWEETGTRLSTNHWRSFCCSSGYLSCSSLASSGNRLPEEASLIVTCLIEGPMMRCTLESVERKRLWTGVLVVQQVGAFLHPQIPSRHWIDAFDGAAVYFVLHCNDFGAAAKESYHWLIEFGDRINNDVVFFHLFKFSHTGSSALLINYRYSSWNTLGWSI